MADRTFEDFTAKATPGNTDIFPFKPIGSLSTKITWAQMKTALASVFAASSHVHSGTDITSGTVATARLNTSAGGNGTADSGKLAIFGASGSLTASGGFFLQNLETGATMDYQIGSLTFYSGSGGIKYLLFTEGSGDRFIVLPNLSGTVMLGNQNLSDLSSAATSKTNLGLATDLFAWRFSTTTTAGDPGSGYFRFNHATTPTAIYISVTAMSGRNVGGILGAFKTYDRIYLESTLVSSQSFSLSITSDPVLTGSYYTIGVSVVSGTTQPANTAACAFRFFVGPRNVNGIDAGSLEGDADPLTGGLLWYDNLIGKYKGYNDISANVVTFATGVTDSWGWKFSTSEVASNPGTGYFRFNDDLAGTITNIYLHQSTQGGALVEYFLQNDFISANDSIYIEDTCDPANYFIFSITSVTDNGSYFTIAGSMEDAGVALPSADSPCSFRLFRSPAAGGAGDVATDTIWDAAGDLVYGTGSNIASRLAIGTAKKTLRVNSGATAPEWVAVTEVLTADFTGTSNTADSVVTTLSTVATAAGLLSANGRSIEIEAFGTFGATSNNKVLTLEWPSTEDVFTTGTVTHNNAMWRLQSKIFREGSGTARYINTFTVDGLPPIVETGTLSVTVTNAGNVKISGTGAALNDVKCTGFIVKSVE